MTNVQLGDFGVFHVKPSSPRAGLVVLQEIFGVNEHVRSVARHWAELGFETAAPALFDPVEKGVELGYGADAVATGRALMEKLGWEKALEGVAKSAEFLHGQGHDKVFVIGYCWGGSVAFRAATRLRGLTAASCYYGRHIHAFRHEKTLIPTIFHYGSQDPSIPMSDVEDVRAAQPGNPVYVYDAGHGFNRDVGDHYDAAAAALAERRTLELFK